MTQGKYSLCNGTFQRGFQCTMILLIQNRFILNLTLYFVADVLNEEHEFELQMWKKRISILLVLAFGHVIME